MRALTFLSIAASLVFASLLSHLTNGTNDRGEIEIASLTPGQQKPTPIRVKKRPGSGNKPSPVPPGKPSPVPPDKPSPVPPDKPSPSPPDKPSPSPPDKPSPVPPDKPSPSPPDKPSPSPAHKPSSDAHEKPSPTTSPVDLPSPTVEQDSLTTSVSPTPSPPNVTNSGYEWWKYPLIAAAVLFAGYLGAKLIFAPRPTFHPGLDPGVSAVGCESGPLGINFQLHLDPNLGEGRYGLDTPGGSFIKSERRSDG